MTEGLTPWRSRAAAQGEGLGAPLRASGSRGFAPGWSRKRFGGDGGVVCPGVPLGLQESLFLGVTGYRYSQVIKSIN